jgi:nucleotide-binding universal stress UspA family protein
VHVIEDRDLRPLRSHLSLSELERMSREAAGGALGEEGVVEQFDKLQILHDTTAETAFEDLVAKQQEETGIVVGRKSPAAGRGWVRLGRIARRLVRSLPGPVVVVPPDLDTARLAEGPIVLAISLEEDSEGATRFAARYAKRWKRELVVMHVVPSFTVGRAPFADSAIVHQVVTQMRADADRGLSDWIASHQLTNARPYATAGDVVDRIVTTADEENAALIVVGSRRLSMAMRLYSSTIGPDVAGVARCPVAVVPPAVVPAS